MKQALFILCILLLSLLSFSTYADEITQNDITISSDKSIYNCEPIYNEKGECLIKAQITIKYLNEEINDLSMSLRFSNDVQKADYKLVASSNLNAMTSAAQNSLKLEQEINIQEAKLAEISQIEQPIKGIIQPQPIEPILHEEKPIASDAISLSEQLEIEKADAFTSKPITFESTDTQVFNMEFWAKQDGKFDFILSNDKLEVVLDPFYSVNISTSTPSYLLENGDVKTSLGINDYLNKTDISTIINDNNDATTVNFYAGARYYPNNLRFYYRFNNPSLMNVVDDNGGDNDMTRLSSTNITKQLDFYALSILNSASGGGIAVSNSNLSIPATDFTYCAVWNSTQTLTNGQDYHIMSVADASTSYEMTLTQSSGNKRVECSIRDDNDGGTFRTAIANMLTINNGSAHTICCKRNISSSTIQTVVDGVVIATSTATSDSSITTFGNLIVSGWQTIGNQGIIGNIDELMLVTKGLTIEEMGRRIFYNTSNGSAIQVYFNYSQKNSSQYKYSIYFHTLNNYPAYPAYVTIYAMLNSTHIDTNKYVEQSISEGHNYISVDSITSTGYNYPYRIVTSKVKPITITEVRLFETGNDTINPHINYCFVNDTNLSCNDGVEWGCDINDNESDVSTVFGVVSFGGYFPITRQVDRSPSNYTRWSIKLTSTEVHELLSGLGWGFSLSVPTTLFYINATDLGGNTQENFTSYPTSYYSCIDVNTSVCVPNWIADSNSCLWNDSVLVSYTDLNNCNLTTNLPTNNNTYLSCNYCNEVITQSNETDCYLFEGNYYKNVTYIDSNYFSCCAITGLVNDCSIDFSPYNSSITDICIEQSVNLRVEYNTKCELGFNSNDKCTWVVDLINYSNSTYNCISYIKDTNQQIIQTNPQHTAQTNSVINLFGKEYEDREYFTMLNSHVSVYFTKENLIFDGRSYIFGVQCNGDGQKYIKEKFIVVGYEDINAPITRFAWYGDNTTNILMFIIGFIVFFLIIVLLIKRLR
jgi:hypothetical protein